MNLHAADVASPSRRTGPTRASRSDRDAARDPRLAARDGRRVDLPVGRRPPGTAKRDRRRLDEGLHTCTTSSSTRSAHRLALVIDALASAIVVPAAVARVGSDVSGSSLDNRQTSGAQTARAWSQRSSLRRRAVPRGSGTRRPRCASLRRATDAAVALINEHSPAAFWRRSSPGAERFERFTARRRPYVGRVTRGWRPWAGTGPSSACRMGRGRTSEFGIWPGTTSHRSATYTGWDRAATRVASAREEHTQDFSRAKSRRSAEGAHDFAENEIVRCGDTKRPRSPVARRKQSRRDRSPASTVRDRCCPTERHRPPDDHGGDLLGLRGIGLAIRHADSRLGPLCRRTPIVMAWAPRMFARPGPKEHPRSGNRAQRRSDVHPRTRTRSGRRMGAQRDEDLRDERGLADVHIWGDGDHENRVSEALHVSRETRQGHQAGQEGEEAGIGIAPRRGVREGRFGQDEQLVGGQEKLDGQSSGAGAAALR